MGYRPRESWSVLGAMIVLSITLNLVTLPLTQVVDPVRKSFGIDDVAFSLLIGAFFAVPSIIMSIFGGWLADRMSRRRLLIGAALLWTAGAVFSVLATTYEQLAMARVIVAIGAGVKFPLAMTWINDAFPPERRGKAVGAFFVVLGLGPAIGASIGGAVLHAAEAGRFASVPVLGALEPWRATLLVLALPTLASLPWVTTLPDGRPAAVGEIGTSTSLGSNDRFPFILLAAMVAGAALLSLADSANLSWLPTVLRRQYHFDARQTGFTFGLIATIAGTAGPMIGGIVGDAVYRRHGTSGRLWVCAGASLGCAPLLASYAGSNATVLICALAISGVFSVLALSLGYVAIQALLPPGQRGIGTGLANAMTQMFGAAAPTIVALTSARAFYGQASLGGGVAVVTVGALLLASGVYAWTAWNVGRWQGTAMLLRSRPQA